MDLRIVYINDAGGLSIIVPSPDCGLSIEQIATKDVPVGRPYAIVDAADIPTDRTFRSAWEVEPELLTDGIGGANND